MLEFTLSVAWIQDTFYYLFLLLNFFIISFYYWIMPIIMDDWMCQFKSNLKELLFLNDYVASTHSLMNKLHKIFIKKIIKHHILCIIFSKDVLGTPEVCGVYPVGPW